jgi:hypothetical protein
MRFFAFTRRTRGKRPTRASLSGIGSAHGRGRARFRIRLTPARGMRWVVLHAYSIDPPQPDRTVVVPIR